MKLDQNEVHIWHASLTVPSSTIRKFRDSLSLSEKVLAEKFRFHRNREQYIFRHGVLRAILSLYANVEAKELTFTQNQYGKPELVKPSPLNLSFNMSYSHEMVLIGVAHGRQIGVDIEYIKKDFDWKEIVERYFSPREIQMINLVPKAMQERAFYACWTQKEAYVKAVGTGLSLPLNECDIAVVYLPAMISNRRLSSGWSIMELDLGNSYVGTVAGEGPDLRLLSRPWF